MSLRTLLLLILAGLLIAVTGIWRANVSADLDRMRRELTVIRADVRGLHDLPCGATLTVAPVSAGSLP